MDEQRGVVGGQEADRRGGVPRRPRRVRQVEELAALLVGEAPQLHAVQRALHDGDRMRSSTAGIGASSRSSSIWRAGSARLSSVWVSVRTASDATRPAPGPARTLV
jgi:hypothetical protein